MTLTRDASPGVADLLASMGLTPDVINDINRAKMAAATDVSDVSDITIPDTPEGLKDLLNDGDRMSKLGAEKMSAVVRAWARHIWDKDKGLADQVMNLTQETLAKLLQENAETGAVPLNFGAPTGMAAGVNALASPVRDKLIRAGLYETRAMGAKLDNEFSADRQGLSEYMRLVWHNAQRDSHAQAKLGRVKAAFSSDVPSEGGFLIPENLRSELLRVALERSIVRPRARVIPMETLRVPFPAIDETSHVSSVYGGVVAYWTEEGAALTESAASFGRIILDAKKLTAYTEVPNELLADSILSLEAFMGEIFPEALAWYEDLAYIKGSGVGEPLGILDGNNPGLVTVAARAGQDPNTIVWENIIDMFPRMLPTSVDRGFWIASHDTFPQLATMAVTVGTGGSAVWLSNGADAPPITILGRPVIFSEKTPGAVGAAGQLSFVDFSYYLIGDRQTMSASSSPHYKFANDRTAYRIIQRVDGRPWLQSPITPQNGSSSTLSAYVQLGDT